MKKKINYLIPLFLSIILLICSIFYFYNHKPKVENYNITLMDAGFDTVITFSAECTQKEFDQYVTIIKEEYTYYNNLFDQYNEYENVNNVYTLNHEAYDHPVQVDDALLECIQMAFNINNINQKFDITQGNLLNLWHNYRTEGIELNKEDKSGKLPSKEEIMESQSHFGKDKVKIEGNKIQFLDSKISIDLGGIAKGFATQKVKEKLIQQECEHGFINAGGNIALIGEKLNGNPWKVGIQDPNSGSPILSYSVMSNKSIVTSGDYQRFYYVDNEKYSHIIDPSTGYPANYMRSVTIICDDSGMADALSTTLFCLSYEEGLKLVSQLQETMDIGVIWIFDSNGNGQIEKNNYSIYYTDNIKDSIKQ